MSNFNKLNHCGFKLAANSTCISILLEKAFIFLSPFNLVLNLNKIYIISSPQKSHEFGNCCIKVMKNWFLDSPASQLKLILVFQSARSHQNSSLIMHTIFMKYAGSTPSLFPLHNTSSSTWRSSWSLHGSSVINAHAWPLSIEG